MAVWRYLAHDLRTNVPLADLPLGDVWFQQRLNAPGQFSAMLPVADRVVERRRLVSQTVDGWLEWPNADNGNTRVEMTASGMAVTAGVVFMARMRADTNTPGNDETLCGRGDWGTSTDRRYLMSWTPGNRLQIRWRTTAGTNVTMATTTNWPVAAGTWHWVIGWLLCDDGAGNRVARFYHAADSVLPPSPAAWTLHQTITTAGTTTIETAGTGGAVQFRVGRDSAGRASRNNRFRRVLMLESPGGPPIVDVDFTDLIAGQTTVVDTAGGRTASIGNQLTVVERTPQVWESSTSTIDMRVLLAATVPERTIIYVERDGVLLDGYVVLQRKLEGGDTPSVQLQGASSLAVLRRNRVVSTLEWAAADQFQIARDLVTHMQLQPGGDIGIDVGSGTSGVARDRTYPARERKNLGDALAELAAVIDGFDFAVDVAWVAGQPAKQLTLSYPRRGRVAGSSGLAVVAGKNLVSYSKLEDGTRSARSVDAFGAGDGEDMLISTATRTDLIDAGWPLTADTVAHKDVTRQDTLDGHALAAVAARAATPEFWSVVVDPDDPECALGSWIIGDDVLLEVFDELHPDGYRRHHRIVEAAVTVPDSGKETVTLTLGSAGG